MTEAIKKSIADIDALIDKTKESDEFIIYKFENSSVEITYGVARHYKDKGYDVFASYNPESNVYGGGDRILIKRQ